MLSNDKTDMINVVKIYDEASNRIVTEFEKFAEVTLGWDDIPNTAKMLLKARICVELGRMGVDLSRHALGRYENVCNANQVLR